MLPGIKKIGDAVKSGELLAEIETDKATMDFESYNTGTLLYIGAEAGKPVAINGVLAIIGEKGADWQTLLKAHEGKSSGEQKAPSTTSAPASTQPVKSSTPVSVPQPVQTGNGRVKASPLAKKLAKEKGLDIRSIPGTGDQGRITKRDVENFKGSGAKGSTFVLPTIVAEESFEEIPVSQMRKTIARRLAESKFTAPHFYLTMEINMDKAIDVRKSINEISPVKVSFNDIVLKAAAMAIRLNPDVNVSWLGEKNPKE